MKKINVTIDTIKEFLSLEIYANENGHVTLGTLLLIIVTLIIVTYLLKLIHKIVTVKLPEEDKNKFISIFNFLKYLFYILVVVTILHS